MAGAGEKHGGRWLYGVAAWDLSVFLIGTYLSYPWRFVRLPPVEGQDGPRFIGPGAVAVTIVFIGVGTFIGFFKKTSDMRLAPTASAWVTYIVVLVAFLNVDVSQRLSTGTAPAMVIALTTLVGAISGFYFRAKNVEARSHTSDV